MNWWAIYCKPNLEQKVNDGIHALGMETFYPFVVKASEKGHVRRSAYFPRYIFMQASEDRLHAVRDVTGLSYIVGSGGVPHAIPDGIIEPMRRRALPSGEILEGKKKRQRMRKGDRIRIADEYNPLWGFMLTVLDVSDIITAELDSGHRIRVPLSQIEVQQ
jgi:transcription antitermination factor NusG